MDNSAQIDYWNGEAGLKWVRDADRMDAMLAPFAEAVAGELNVPDGARITDIGCGAGALSLLLAQRVAQASITGVDVSAPLAALAQARASRAGVTARFEVADAALWRPTHPADAAVSRFGVMFFAEPANAFANIRAGIRPGGWLAFACWRSLAENAWANVPLEAAVPFLAPLPPPPDPRAPGPFAFADPSYLSQVLQEAGWGDIRISPWDGLITLPGDDVAGTAEFMLSMGPLARLMTEQGGVRDGIAEALVARLSALADPQGRVRLPAAAWIVGAQA